MKKRTKPSEIKQAFEMALKYVGDDWGHLDWQAPGLTEYVRASLI